MEYPVKNASVIGEKLPHLVVLDFFRALIIL